MDCLINIDVPDLERGVAFYSEAVGLRLRRMLDDDVAELGGSSSRVFLLLKEPGSRPARGSTDVRDVSRHWTPVHMDFVVEDLEAASQRAVAAGALRESPCVEWRGSRCISFSDPFGNGFCLIEFDGDSYR